MTPASIFIVEDEVLIAMELEERLRQLNYTVCGHVTQGEEACVKVEDLHPDLILMDISLAGAMNGIEAAERIRQAHDISVVFLSAFSDNDLLRKAAHVEPHGYLVKPFEERELHATITMALYRHQMERERAELTRKLQRAVDEIRELRALLPFCAWCKQKIREEDDQWVGFETYIKRHLGNDITHSICPECFAQEKTKL
ncbi:MAG: response regulator [Deltaproteobacteria bacterium]|jgi:DNA-binding NarL/FixJ family response regulator|nr:response regulator [Deltaproteobacteria bacterium]